MFENNNYCESTGHYLKFKATFIQDKNTETKLISQLYEVFEDHISEVPFHPDDLVSHNNSLGRCKFSSKLSYWVSFINFQ